MDNVFNPSYTEYDEEIQKFAKILNLDAEETVDFVYDINGLRGDEWLEYFEGENEAIINEYKKFIHYSDDVLDDSISEEEFDKKYNALEGIRKKLVDYICEDLARQENFTDMEISYEKNEMFSCMVAIDMVMEMSEKECAEYLYAEEELSNKDMHKYLALDERATIAFAEQMIKRVDVSDADKKVWSEEIEQCKKKLQKFKLQKAAYELYKQDWIDTHTSREQRLDDIRDWVETYLTEKSLNESYKEFVEEYGYCGGQYYASFNEFIENEYLDQEYIEELFGSKNLIDKYSELVEGGNNNE